MSKVFTRRELTMIDQYPTLSAVGIAAELGVTEQTIYKWFKLLGIRCAHIIHVRAKQPIEKANGKACRRCGIKLAAAARMDKCNGAIRTFVLDGKTITGICCAYCVSKIDGNPWLFRLPLGGGDAPELAVFWALGQAAGRDERKVA